jgi:hypothetical protein
LRPILLRPASIPILENSQRLVAEIDADVEMTVIPLGVMLATPLARGIHSRDIVIRLTAVFAVAGDVPVDFRTIGFESLGAVILPVSIGPRW